MRFPIVLIALVNNTLERVAAFLLAIYSTSIFWLVFFVEKNISQWHISFEFRTIEIDAKNVTILVCFMYLILFLLLWLAVEKWLIPGFPLDSYEGAKNLEVERLDKNFVPTIIGYCFVALSVGNLFSAIVVYFIIVFVVSVTGEALGAGLIVFGFKGYKIVSKNGMITYLFSKNNYKRPLEVEISKVYRLTNLTYVEL